MEPVLTIWVRLIRSPCVHCTQESAKRWAVRRGMVPARHSGGLPVQFNGFNTAAVAAPWVFDLRKNLVQNEGFRSQTYKDTLGNDTIGVGLTGNYAPKPGPDGKISKEQLDQAFWKASNDAATSGKRVASALGMQQDRNAFLLFSELAYQSGNNFSDLRSYRPFIDALRSVIEPRVRRRSRVLRRTRHLPKAVRSTTSNLLTI